MLSKIDGDEIGYSEESGDAAVMVIQNVGAGWQNESRSSVGFVKWSGARKRGHG